MFQKIFSGVCGKPKVSADSQAKTRSVLFGIAVMLIAAVFILSFAGCDNGSTDDGGGGGYSFADLLYLDIIDNKPRQYG
jgi:hypothetical protein